MRLTIQTTKNPAVTITRRAVRTKGLVYIAVANKKIQYPGGKSRIVYIGTTKGGARRIAVSAAHKAGALVGRHGITHLEFFVVTASAIDDVATWKILERGLLITFREIFGTTPECNIQGKGFQWRDELDYFTSRRLESVINQYSDLAVSAE